jgi:hypothetical protein
MKRNEKKNAFIFTTDAFLVLPLIILTISTFISFSMTLRENTIKHEYTYMLARDSLNYLSEITMAEANLSSSTLTVLDNVTSEVVAGHMDSANRTVNESLSRYIPASAAYILEYKNITSGDWIPITQAGDTGKILRPTIQVSEIRIVTALTQPSINYSTNCAQDIMCTIPATRYTAGQVVGPLMLRIRVFS